MTAPLAERCDRWVDNWGAKFETRGVSRAMGQRWEQAEKVKWNKRDEMLKRREHG